MTSFGTNASVVKVGVGADFGSFSTKINGARPVAQTLTRTIREAVWKLLRTIPSSLFASSPLSANNHLFWRLKGCSVEKSFSSFSEGCLATVIPLEKTSTFLLLLSVCAGVSTCSWPNSWGISPSCFLTTYLVVVADRWARMSSVSCYGIHSAWSLPSPFLETTRIHRSASSGDKPTYVPLSDRLFSSEVSADERSWEQKVLILRDPKWRHFKKALPYLKKRGRIKNIISFCMVKKLREKEMTLFMVHPVVVW